MAGSPHAPWAGMQRHPAERLADLLEPLCNYSCRRLRYYEAIGELGSGQLSPADIVDLTYLEAGEYLRHQPSDERGYRWLRQLAERVLRREIERLRKEQGGAP